MWFNTNFFVAPKKFNMNGQEDITKETSFSISGEKKKS